MNEAKTCGGCAWWSQPRDGYNYGICGFPVLLPVTVLKADWNLTLASGGADCQTFKKREPEIVPATIDDVTGGPWNPAPPAPAMHTCGSCKWWNPRSADKRTGSCEFQVVTPASSPYPIDRTPMHETEGDDCRCFERKEG